MVDDQVLVECHLHQVFSFTKSVHKIEHQIGLPVQENPSEILSLDSVKDAVLGCPAAELPLGFGDNLELAKEALFHLIKWKVVVPWQIKLNRALLDKVEVEGDLPLVVDHLVLHKVHPDHALPEFDPKWLVFYIVEDRDVLKLPLEYLVEEIVYILRVDPVEHRDDLLVLFRFLVLFNHPFHLEVHIAGELEGFSDLL